MEPKKFLGVSLLLNLIIFGVLFWLAYTFLFDSWIKTQVLTNLCSEKDEAGEVVLKYCPDPANPTAVPAESSEQ
jgi:hypothetical protein